MDRSPTIWGLPCCLILLPYMPSSLPRRDRWFSRSLHVFAWPFVPSGGGLRLDAFVRLGSRISLFEACSTFTRVTACRFAESLLRPFAIEGFDEFVTSFAAPTATGWSALLPDGTFTR